MKMPDSEPLSVLMLFVTEDRKKHITLIDGIGTDFFMYKCEIKKISCTTLIDVTIGINLIFMRNSCVQKVEKNVSQESLKAHVGSNKKKTIIDRAKVKVNAIIIILKSRGRLLTFVEMKSIKS